MLIISVLSHCYYGVVPYFEPTSQSLRLKQNKKKLKIVQKLKKNSKGVGVLQKIEKS